jgi:hypothetical protein
VGVNVVERVCGCKDSSSGDSMELGL